MAKTIKLTTEQLEIDENNQSQYSTEIEKIFDFDESFKKELIFANSAGFTSIGFGEVSNPVLLVLTSTQNLDVLINSQQYQNTKFIVMNATLTNLSVKNVSTPNATVTISLYGEA